MATHSSNSCLVTSYECNKMKKKDHRLIRVTPSIQMLEIPEGARHTEGKNRLRGLRVQDLDPCEWGETHSLQTLRLGSHIHSLQGKPPSPDPAPGVAQSLVRTPGLCWMGPKAETSGFL